jgi:hypothetical protein
MAFFKLTLAPGIDKQNTEYGAEGGWSDCDNVRFRYGLPEKIGGWTYFESGEYYLVGQASEAFSWQSLPGIPYFVVGTNRKVYVNTGAFWYDITPLRLTSSAGDITFSASTGSTAITVTHVDHGAEQGGFVIYSGAVSLGGDITADILNSEWEIGAIINSSTYTITAPVAATSGDSGSGGASVVGKYQINVGSDVSFYDYGYGTGTWGAGSFGTPRPETLVLSLLSRTWTFDNYGENLILQLVDGAIYQWSPTTDGVAVRANPISGAPTKSVYALVSSPDRHLVCFGSEATIGDPDTQDPMFVRFSDQENINTFVESATNTAGGQRLSDGSYIVSAVRSRGQILIFTDTSLHGMQYIGPPYTFGFQQLAANCGCAGSHAAVDVNGLAFWMGIDSFFVFDGTVKKMSCTVQDYVFKDINLVQRSKFYAALNNDFNEVTWFYASYTSDYIDRCVVFNYLENVWSIGTLSRTAWQDVGAYVKPAATEYLPTSTEATISTIYGLTQGRSLVYNQEDGINKADGSAILANIESGYFDIGDGDSMLLMNRFIPDFKDQQGDVIVNLYLRPYPQASASPSSLDPYTVTPTTQKVDTRARGRQIAVKIKSDNADTWWRYGTLRVDIKPDGMR